MHLRWTLIFFDIIADLKVNLQKRKLTPMRRVPNIKVKATLFGFKDRICLLYIPSIGGTIQVLWCMKAIRIVF